MLSAVEAPAYAESIAIIIALFKSMQNALYHINGI